MSGTTRTLALLVCVVLLSTAFFVANPSASRNARAAAPIIMTIGSAGDDANVDSFNPFAGYSSMAYQVYVLMYDMLVGVSADLTPTPQIAESWSSNAQGDVWTYNIRHGMTWHDGTPVTANDVNFTYNMVLDNPDQCALVIDYFRNFTDVRALDDYTVQITTEVPKATMRSIICPILPAHLWSAVPAKKISSVDVWDTNYFPNGPVGSGPFKLVDYAIDDFVWFEKFPGYYGGTINIDVLIYKSFLSEAAMLNALYAGTIDVACGVPPDSWQTTLDKPNIDGQAVEELEFDEIGMNVCPPNLRVGGASNNLELLNLSVRQAIAMAVNKTELVKNVWLGYGEEGSTLIPPASRRWHYNITDAEKYNFDLDAANALLDAAGYVDSDGDGTRENSTSGVPLDFKFYYIVDDSEMEACSYLIEEWLGQIGISAPPNGISESTLYRYWIGMTYDLFVWNWGGDADPTFLLSVVTTDQIPSSKTDWSAWSDCFYSNPYYDYLFVEQMNTVNITQRQQMVYEMQRIVYRDTPYVIMCYPLGLYAYRSDRFTNWPDMEAHPGEVPRTGTAGGPWLFFELIPVTGNLPPQNVDAGIDTTVALGETRSFTGYAEDEDFATLNWTWKFAEPGGANNFRYGQTVSYTFNNVGTVTVTLVVRDSGGLEGQDVLSVTVQPVPNAGWLVGYVTDTADSPIVAATVTTGSTSATTNAAGYYNMTLSAGVYDVTADAHGYQSASQTATVVEGATTMLNFSLITSSGSLRGHVYDSDTGDPIEGAVVSVRMGDASKLAMTNSMGAYQILLLEAGTYDVNVTKSGYETNTTQVAIQVGQETVLEINLEPSGKGGGGLGTAALAAIVGIVVIIIVAAVVLMLMRRKKTEAPPPPEAPKT